MFGAKYTYNFEIHSKEFYETFEFYLYNSKLIHFLIYADILLV